MLFNSNEFLIFFLSFTALYWLLRRWLTARNILIVAASYVFYCWWDYRFGALLLFTSLADFSLARLIEASAVPSRRKALLTLSVGLNLCVLGFFKYFGFFSERLRVLLQPVGWGAHWHVLQIVLPIGISFYTFQSLGYVIDVYRGNVVAVRSVVQFLAFVSFFPQLVAGPIERAANLIPQFTRTLRITAANLEHGIWLVVWGLFQKVVLADNLASLVELVYDHAEPSLPGWVLGTCAFALQICCDFAGYSDIARGLAKLLGFELMINFNAPYLAGSLREFWQRWNISLSTWIRDYLYIPLGGNRRGEARTYLNLFVAMLLAGLWHGAALNFLFWGLWHGCGLALNRIWERLRPTRYRLPHWVGWALTMSFVLVGWFLFRARSFDQILGFAASLSVLVLPMWWKTYTISLLILATPLILMQVWQVRRGQSETFAAIPRWARMWLQGVMLLAVLAWWKREAATFIYFQF